MATTGQAKNKGDEIKATGLSKEDRAFITEHGDQLSDSTKRAKWIHAPNETADRDGQTLATREHAVIQAWAEERGGVPATVPGTEHDDHAGVLRFKFDDAANDRIAEIAWDEWFRTFDERNLVFVYQQNKADGNQSTFFRLDNPEREDA